MELVYLPATVADFEWMRGYYSDVFPDGASKAQARFRAMERLLLQHPRIGKPTDFQGVYELVIARTPFSVIYRIVPERIEVLRIWDNRGDRSALIV